MPDETIATTLPPNGISLGEQAPNIAGTLMPVLLVALVLLIVALAAVTLSRKRGKSRKPGDSPHADITQRVRTREPSAQAEDSEPVIRIGNSQHIGSRKDQQDCFGISDVFNERQMAEKGLLVVLADGMGGLAHGQVIANTVVRTMLSEFKTVPPQEDSSALLLTLLKEASGRVSEVQGEEKGGSTVVAALVRDRKLSCLSVGDSRIYLLRNGGLVQLNREHVYGRELDDLVANGTLSTQSAQSNAQRKALTSYVGISGNMNIDRNTRPIDLYPGDKVVLMSDGVYNVLDESEMIPLLLQEPMKSALDVQAAALAKRHPQQDNLTIVVLGL